MSTPSRETDRFHRDLCRLVNGGAVRAAPASRRHAAASELSRRYRRLFPSSGEKVHRCLTVDVGEYTGGNRCALRLGALLRKRLQRDLRGAYVHGSVGTGEEIEYSDFDGLVILADGALEDPGRLQAAALWLHRSRAIMLDFDPLQHHGWHVLAQGQLQHYPEHLFPRDLLRHARSLYPEQGRRLRLGLRNQQHDATEPFATLSGSLAQSLETVRPVRNLHQLKVLLSRFMLLPALYVQGREGTGIFKKFSFAAAAKDFPAKDWEIMEEVAGIRREWRSHVSPLRKLLMTRPLSLARYSAAWFAPPVPHPLRRHLDQDFFRRMRSLTALMREKLL